VPAELLVADLQTEPRGLLRVSAPVYFGELHIAALIATLALRHPELRVELSLGHLALRGLGRALSGVGRGQAQNGFFPSAATCSALSRSHVFWK
jgi:DNA-binding transcriptional LysR family regulator